MNDKENEIRMADYFYKDGKKYYKNQSLSDHQQDNCFVETHTIAGSGANLNGNIPITIFLEGITPQTVFEDFTKNHNKTLIQLFVVGQSAPVIVTIRTRGSRTPITAIIQPAQTKIFQVEDFQSLTLTRQEGPSSLVSLFVQKTFILHLL